MIFRAFDELITAMPAVFWSELSPPDAAKLLASESGRGPLLDERVVGGVDGASVSLHRHQPFSRNPFAPVFEGEFRDASNGSQLVGHFRRRKFALLLCGGSYFILLVGIPFALAATPLMAFLFDVPIGWGVVAGTIAALVLVVALFAVAAVVRLGMYAAKQDAGRISEHIETVFSRGSG